jgi:LuxR family transcriptional regulator of spore coat protein
MFRFGQHPRVSIPSQFANWQLGIWTTARVDPIGQNPLIFCVVMLAGKNPTYFRRLSSTERYISKTVVCGALGPCRLNRNTYACDGFQKMVNGYITKTCRMSGEALANEKIGELRVARFSPLQADSRTEQKRTLIMLRLDQLETRPTLTQREHQILELVAVGLSAKEVAQHIDIAPRTVERHIENIRLKMRARNRTHMVTCAAMSGMLTAATAAEPDLEIPDTDMVCMTSEDIGMANVPHAFTASALRLVA